MRQNLALLVQVWPGPTASRFAPAATDRARVTTLCRRECSSSCVLEYRSLFAYALRRVDCRVRREGRKGAVGGRQKHDDENLHAVSCNLAKRLSWKETAVAFRTTWRRSSIRGMGGPVGPATPDLSNVLSIESMRFSGSEPQVPYRRLPDR